MSRHHILPPIVHTLEPPKLAQTRRRRRVAHARGATAAGDAAETDETDETGTAAPVQALPPHSQPVEAVERRNSSTTGKLSADTLQALLAAQEESGQDHG